MTAAHYRKRGKACRRKKDFAGAEYYFTKEIELAPKWVAAAYVRRGRIYAELAAADFRKARKQSPVLLFSED